MTSLRSLRILVFSFKSVCRVSMLKVEAIAPMIAPCSFLIGTAAIIITLLVALEIVASLKAYGLPCCSTALM